MSPVFPLQLPKQANHQKHQLNYAFLLDYPVLIYLKVKKRSVLQSALINTQIVYTREVKSVAIKCWSLQGHRQWCDPDGVCFPGM